MAKVITIHRRHNNNASLSTSGKAKGLPHADTMPLSGLNLPYAVAIAGVALACLGIAVVHWGGIGTQDELRPQARNQKQLKLSGLPALRAPHSGSVN